MHTFSVWSPAAERVDVRLSGAGTTERSEPMRRCEDGWWSVDVADAGHGTRYAYCVDGGTPLPDPRSPWQPDDVHSASAVFDTGRHAWLDAGWDGLDVRGRVLYELHVGTFTPEGTLDAAAERLDHLVGLGVEMVQLMPVAAFPGRHGWGYDGVALFAVHEPYGGPAALQRFVDACHAKGLAVSLDVVYNHLGPSGNYLAAFGPYFTDRHETPWGQAVNLDDTGSEQVRRWVVDNALRWLRDFHVDALRLDAVHALVDDSERHLLSQLSDEVAELSREVDRPLSLVAESDVNDPVMVEPVADGGLGMTAQWSDDYHHALHAFLTGERQGYYADFGGAEVLARTLTRVFRHDGGWSSFRGSDWGAPVDRQRHDGRAFLAYGSNHDQVGNRAVGDRPSASLPPGTLAGAAALTLCSPFTPMLFMGEEWGASTPWQFFTDHGEPELAEAIREGRRREFAEHGWDADQVPDPQDPATRDASVLRWEETHDDPHRRLLAWYTRLVALRHREPDLHSGDLTAVSARHADDGSWFCLSRGALRVALNLSASPLPVPVDGTPGEVMAAWDRAETGPGTVILPPRSVALVRV